MSSSSDSGQTLADRIRKNSTIAEDEQGEPWMEDGNILLVSDQAVFKTYMGLLAHSSPVLFDMYNLEFMDDDTVDMVDDCPLIELDDPANDLSSFLEALNDGIETP